MRQTRAAASGAPVVHGRARWRGLPAATAATPPAHIALGGLRTTMEKYEIAG
ncbi:MAG: hypothetical protein HYY06_04395 [Deltaproteobacteria bacterium]|nr:hypothetical protein [Deltaproteobacteria bacterium]